MIVLDAYAVLALLRAEPAAREVQALLAGDEPVQLTATGVAEVVDRLARLGGVDPEEAALDLAELGLADGSPVDAAIGLRAGALRARRYHRTTCAMSLADCVVVETARAAGARVATSDPHLLDVCAAEGVDVVVLPGTDGRRWSPPGAG